MDGWVDARRGIDGKRVYKWKGYKWMEMEIEREEWREGVVEMEVGW